MPFLDRRLPVCSVIRPTETQGVATATVKFWTDMGLFIGQSLTYFQFLQDLAAAAGAATREI